MSSHVRVLRVSQGDKSWLKMSFERNNEVGQTSVSVDAAIPPSRAEVTQMEGLIRRLAPGESRGLIEILRRQLDPYRS